MWIHPVAASVATRQELPCSAEKTENKHPNMPIKDQDML